MIKCDCGNDRFTASVVLYVDGKLEMVKDSVWFFADTLQEETMVNDNLLVTCIKCGTKHRIENWDRPEL